jgi:hypothetical protein
MKTFHMVHGHGREPGDLKPGALRTTMIGAGRAAVGRQ